MQNLPKFLPNQSAKNVDQKLKASLRIKEAAHQCSLEWFGEIYNRKLFRNLGFSTVNQYARQELGFSNSKIGHFINLTKKLEKLPELKNSISKGELGYTLGRVLIDVVDNTNDAPRAVVPIRVNIEMTPTQLARYEKLWEQIRKKHHLSPEKVEALLEIMDGFLNNPVEDSEEEKNYPRGYISRPTTQVHIHHCPECESSTVQTSKGELQISKADYERALCDCQIETLESPKRTAKRNKTSIAPAVRRQVLANARHKCETPGCENTRFLEIHHIVPRSKGGANDLGNLKCQCSYCHRLIHESRMMVKEPVTGYSWIKRPQRWLYFGA